MPLQENPNLANKQKIAHYNSSLKPVDTGTDTLSVMRTRSRPHSSVPTSLASRKTYDSVSEPPANLPVDDVPISLNMAQLNGGFREQTASPQDASRPGRVISATMMRSAVFSATEPNSTPDTAWSSAIGHASTGKSGRVIEKLQGEIDRLRRENQLFKVQFDEIEKANETMAARHQYLQDRNSNYEASHEANVRQLDRKERQVQDLREELRKEKEKTARAEERASIATTNEEAWRDQASHAKAVASQKEVEYDAIAACRNMDNDRHQGGIDQIKANFGILMKQREEDVEKHKKLQIIAEQQRKTIQHLEQLTQRLNANFRAYRLEIDSAIEGLRQNAGTNDVMVHKKLQEMEDVTGQMRWIVNVEQVINHKQSPPRPTTPEDHHEGAKSRDQTNSSPRRKTVYSMDFKGRHGKKLFGKSSK